MPVMEQEDYNQQSSDDLFTKEEVRKLLPNLNITKSPGPNRVNSKRLFGLASLINKHLSMIFNSDLKRRVEENCLIKTTHISTNNTQLITAEENVKKAREALYKLMASGLHGSIEIEDNFWHINNNPMPVVDHSSHIGIQKCQKNSAKLIVDENIKKASGEDHYTASWAQDYMGGMD
ncbi:unnamed protein product [Mytilus edulis]|uniref:Uncharacterized protein n=1 Tax=Mytilus edulis TaxID=6550 RepID=A0A8S3RXX5_MYTED|nr:unnamed protein product [Mytilus edulis]